MKELQKNNSLTLPLKGVNQMNVMRNGKQFKSIQSTSNGKSFGKSFEKKNEKEKQPIKKSFLLPDRKNLPVFQSPAIIRPNFTSPLTSINIPFTPKSAM